MNAPAPSWCSFTVPGPPINVVNTAPVSEVSLTVSWTVPYFDGGKPITSYTVRCTGTSPHITGPFTFGPQTFSASTACTGSSCTSGVGAFIGSGSPDFILPDATYT